MSLSDISGIDAALEAKLAERGITSSAGLAAAELSTLADIPGVTIDRAVGLQDAAQADLAADDPAVADPDAIDDLPQPDVQPDIDGPTMPGSGKSS